LLNCYATVLKGFYAETKPAFVQRISKVQEAFSPHEHSLYPVSHGSVAPELSRTLTNVKTNLSVFLSLRCLYKVKVCAYRLYWIEDLIIDGGLSLSFRLPGALKKHGLWKQEQIIARRWSLPAAQLVVYCWMDCSG